MNIRAINHYYEHGSIDFHEAAREREKAWAETHSKSILRKVKAGEILEAQIELHECGVTNDSFLSFLNMYFQKNETSELVRQKINEIIDWQVEQVKANVGQLAFRVAVKAAQQ